MVYYGKDIWSDSFEHKKLTWKYIRKEFKNGRWQYYYGDHNDKKAGEKSLKVLNAFAKVSGMNAKTNAQRAVKNTKLNKSASAKKAAEKAVAKYKATPIGIIDSYKEAGQKRYKELVEAWYASYRHEKGQASGSSGKK